MLDAGFEWYSFDNYENDPVDDPVIISGDELLQGDILVCEGHMEIFDHYDENGNLVVYSWGSTSSTQPHRSSRNVSDYSGVWRLSD